jgi:hypothetical protein
MLKVCYASDLADNHQDADHYQPEKLGFFLLVQHPHKYTYPKKQGRYGDGVGCDVNLLLNLDLFSSSRH